METDTVLFVPLRDFDRWL